MSAESEERRRKTNNDNENDDENANNLSTRPLSARRMSASEAEANLLTCQLKKKCRPIGRHFFVLSIVNYLNIQ